MELSGPSPRAGQRWGPLEPSATGKPFYRDSARERWHLPAADPFPRSPGEEEGLRVWRGGATVAGEVASGKGAGKASPLERLARRRPGRPNV
jgi:hypothetical protein